MNGSVDCRDHVFPYYLQASAGKNIRPAHFAAGEAWPEFDASVKEQLAVMKAYLQVLENEHRLDFGFTNNAGSGHEI